MGWGDREHAAAALLTGAQGMSVRGLPESLDQLESLAASGSTAAMIALGIAHWRGPIINMAEAERWFRAAHRSPTEQSYYWLGRLLALRGRPDEAMKVFAEGAAEGYGSSRCWLAMGYLFAAEPTSDRDRIVRTLLEQASQQGYIRATRILISVLMRGTYGPGGMAKGIATFFQFLGQLFSISLKNPDDPRLVM